MWTCGGNVVVVAQWVSLPLVSKRNKIAVAYARISWYMSLVRAL